MACEAELRATKDSAQRANQKVSNPHTTSGARDCVAAGMCVAVVSRWWQGLVISCLSSVRRARDLLSLVDAKGS